MSKKTTTTRRRSSRLKSKQIEKEEQEREQEEEEEEEEAEVSVEAEIEKQQQSEEDEEQPSEEEEDYSNKLRRRRGSGSNVEQDLTNLEGDPDADYTDGDCVWAKYLDYPWWPGQIELNTTHSRRRKRAKRSTVTVVWFGDFPVKKNVCKLVNVIPWDPDDRDRIYVDVNDENNEAFQDSMDSANTVYLELCEERGGNPLQSALDYDEKNASRYAQQQAEEEKEKENKDDDDEDEEEEEEKESTTSNRKKTVRGKTKKNTKKQTPKQSKKKKEEAKEDEIQTEAPDLEPIDDIDLNERQASLRSAKKSKPKQSPKETVQQRKSVRTKGRKSVEKEEDKQEKKAPKRKRGRKRKYDEAMNGDKEAEEEQDKNEENEENDDENDDVDVMDLTEKEKEKETEEKTPKRRSARVKAKNEENDDNLSDLYPESELSASLDSAWEMCEETHSAPDFTPWIALFYFGIKKYNKEGDKDKDVTNTVANIFHLEQDQVLNHLSEFTELAAKITNPKKKRKTK